MNAFEKVVKKEYSVGGEIIPRGYYCPSPVYDLIFANCYRGKLLRKVTIRSKPDYEYCFDKDKRLIIVNSLHSKEYEFLVYQGYTVVGITFSEDNGEIEINQIIECEYDSKQRIKEYILASDDMDEIYIEKYIYSSEGLSEIISYNSFKENIEYLKYKFNHDEEGYLSTYTVTPSMFENIYVINEKRKI